MSQQAEAGHVSASRAASRGTSGWVGWIAFAATMMVMVGTFHMIQGLVALFNDDYYLVGRSGLIVNLDFTAWGWVHLLGGAVLLVAGLCVFAGQVWARVVGVVAAVFSALINVSFLAAYPLWCLMMIALDVVVILALTVHGSEIKPES